MSDDPDLSAAELALGLLEGEDRAVALRRVLAEPDFAAEVVRWREHFAALFPVVPAAEPDPALLPRIERSLAPAGADVTPIRRGWVWPSLAGMTSVAAAALAMVLLSRPEPAPVQASVPVLLAAAVVPTTSGEAMSAVYEPASGRLRMPAAPLADARHSAELWVIGRDGVPHSLGLLNGAKANAMIVSPADRARLGAAAVLAVSIEPVGGSPTGLPTGPVVAKGTLAQT